MKRIFLLLFFIPILGFAQDTLSFFEEMKNITENERRAAARLFGKELSSAASTNFDVHHYRCEWVIHPASWYISGRVTPSFKMIGTGNEISLDMQAALVVDSVVYHNNKIVFEQKAGDELLIRFPANIPAGAKDSVSVYYHGVPLFTGMGAFYQYSHAGVPIIWTLSEPYGSKYWWPCKDGLTDKADSIDILITHPAIYTASSIGMEQSRIVTDTMATTHFRHRHPIATYLVALAVTNYLVDNDTVTVGNKSYPFISYAYPESWGTFFGQEIYAKNSMRTFVKFFGDYPFEKYGHTQWSKAAGMEHQTNSFMFNTSPTLSAHELGHQWFGDKITCASWSDVWLNEGLTTYAAGLYLLDNLEPRWFAGFLSETLTNIVSQPDGSVYVSDTTDINRIFSSRLSYNKGAYVTHMLRWVLGDSVFFRGLRRYLNDPAITYGFARTADLRRNLEQESGKNLASFFQKWIYGEGYPNYNASWSQNVNNWVTLKLDQSTSHPSVSFYEMPVMLEFRSGTQSKKVVVDHSFNGKEFNIQLDFKADTVIIDPDLWILSKTKTSKKLSSSTQADLIRIYPNPSPRDAVVMLENPTGSKLSVQLFNNAGQLLYKKDISGLGQNQTIHLPLTHLPRGVYSVELRNEKGLKVVKRLVH